MVLGPFFSFALKFKWILGPNDSFLVYGPWYSGLLLAQERSVVCACAHQQAVTLGLVQPQQKVLHQTKKDFLRFYY